jgi:two-component system, NarL family, response regulator LiaR
MWKTILLYAFLLAGLTAALKLLEYRYLIRDLSLEFYLGIIALAFTAIGVWAGLKLTRKKMLVMAQPSDKFTINENNLKQLGISKREQEVLELIAKGLSNQEIADKLFVSQNTVKTHLSNLFLKLEAKRRTQAIQKAKELSLIP